MGSESWEKPIQLYRHCDGYPDSEHGVLATLKEAIHFCWQFPRFEASDFSAAIIRAWKKEGGGNIYIDGVADGDKYLHVDIEWLYVIRPPQGESIKPRVEVWRPHSYPHGSPVWTGLLGEPWEKEEEKEEENG
jgi:hypothetical protein